MIVADDVTLARGGTARVRGVSLTLAPGQLLGLVGPNGAGKSTLLAGLAGDIAAARGRISYGGVDARALTAAALAQRRAVLTQHPSAPPFRAWELVALGHVDGSPPARRRTRALVRLAEVGLADRARQPVTTMSGGERQRVHVARVREQLGDGPPRALLLDEPVAALDPRHQHAVLALARRAAAHGHAVAVVLHDLNLAAAYADRIAVLAAGALVTVGAPAEVLVPAILEPVFGIGFVHRPGPPPVIMPRPWSWP